MGKEDGRGEKESVEQLLLECRRLIDAVGIGGDMPSYARFVDKSRNYPLISLNHIPHTLSGN